METTDYYLERARQCRRLLRATSDQKASQGLNAMAEEFDAKAKAAETSACAVDLPGGEVPLRLGSGNDGDLS